MYKRLNPEVRHDQIIAAALKLAKRVGFANITRDRIAKEAKVSTGLVSKYGDMPKIRTAVMKMAIDEQALSVIAQGLASGDATAKRAPQALRLAAMKSAA